MEKQTAEDDRRTVDAAYGLVLGSYDGLLGDDKAGWHAWNDPAISESALKAAREFIASLPPPPGK